MSMSVGSEMDATNNPGEVEDAAKLPLISELATPSPACLVKDNAQHRDDARETALLADVKALPDDHAVMTASAVGVGGHIVSSESRIPLVAVPCTRSQKQSSAVSVVRLSRLRYSTAPALCIVYTLPHCKGFICVVRAWKVMLRILAAERPWSEACSHNTGRRKCAELSRVSGVAAAAWNFAGCHRAGYDRCEQMHARWRTSASTITMRRLHLPLL